MNNDPQKILDENPMSTMQFVAVAMCVLLNALDGFDVLSIAFSAPGITSDWGITRAALGIVLSMELIGMAFGAIVCGGLADKFGRRPLILGCLIVVGAGMLAAGMSTGGLFSVLVPSYYWTGNRWPDRFRQLPGCRILQ